MKRKVSAMVKGMTRADWCRMITHYPKPSTPLSLAQRCAAIAKGRAAQMAKDGCLFGGKGWWQLGKKYPPYMKIAEPDKQPVPQRIKPDLNLYRTAVD